MVSGEEEFKHDSQHPNFEDLTSFGPSSLCLIFWLVFITLSFFITPSTLGSAAG